MRLKCIQLELDDGSTVELKGTYKNLTELKADIVHRIFKSRSNQEPVRSGAVLQTAIDCGYNSTSAVEHILKQPAP